MAFEKLFPSVICVSKLDSSSMKVKKLNEELKTEALKLSEVDEAGIRWSQKNYRGGYTSYGSMDQLDQFSSTYMSLRKALDPHVMKYAKELEMNLSGRKLRMTSLWVNIMPQGVVHTMHIHPLSTISGTYYVQTPKNSSALKFEDPRMVNFMASPPRSPKAQRDNQRFVSISPEAGQVILFESWMRHEVPPNLSKDPRISVSFNYDWL